MTRGIVDVLCGVCGERRQRKTLRTLAVPVRFIVNYATGESREFPAGTTCCYNELRKISTVGGGSTSDGQSIVFVDGKIVRVDGSRIFIEM